MKRFLSILLIAILVIIQIPVIGFAEPGNISSLYKPVFSIEGGSVPNGNAGGRVNIPLSIKNNGGSAKDLVITPSFGPDSPFTPNNLTESITVGDISGRTSKSINLDLVISPTAKAGTYPVTLDFNYTYISYENETLSTHTGSHKEIIYVRVSNQTTQPKIIITKVTTNPETILPGQNVKVNVMFENKGNLDVKNVTAKIEGLKNDGGFYVTSGSDIAFVKNVSGNAVSFVEFNLKAANNIKRGAHELKINFSYNGIEEAQVIYLNVGGTGNQGSNLLIENLTYPTTSIKPNQDFVINFDLRNNGSNNANNVLIKLESSDPSAVIPKTTSIKKINNIAANEKESLEFVFSPTKGSTTQNYPINISIEYQDDFSQDSETKYQINQYVGIYVNNPEKETGDPIKTTPKLIIDKYNFDPGLVRAGENFQMHLSFLNTNSKKSVKNIKIFLTAEPNAGTDPNSPSAGSSVFTPVDSSNTFYIDSIPPKGNVQKTITMFTVPDAVAKTHTITANFEYEDTKGESYTATELIGVPVIQQSRLETGELNYYPEAFLGEPIPISLEFYNTGKVPLYNMMVKLEGDFQTEAGSSYIGNFDNGSSEYFEGMVIPNEPGLLEGEVVFTYEDSTGEPQELRRDFSLNVMDAPPMEEFPGEFPPEDDGGGIKGLLKSKGLWITLILIAAAGGGFFFYKKKKKEKELALDE